MTTATKTKRVKIDDVTPPAEIRENTKARRAWLAAEAARLNAQPETEAKIVGQGSYQRISVYRVTQVEGRLRHRGVCQCCGRTQVVDGGVLVLHGYNRPGDGAIMGRCPGTNEKPLNVDKTLTDAWYANAVKKHEAAEIAETAAAQEEKAALGALYRGDEAIEPDAWQEQPRRVNSYDYNGRPEARLAAVMAYREAFTRWAAKFPLHGRYERAQIAHREARNTAWQAKQEREHFAGLLASGAYGSPLIDEVVPGGDAAPRGGKRKTVECGGCLNDEHCGACPCCRNREGR